jgi:hypothetical protein
MNNFAVDYILEVNKYSTIKSKAMVGKNGFGGVALLEKQVLRNLNFYQTFKTSTISKIKYFFP